jgi:hypothetical protein
MISKPKLPEKFCTFGKNLKNNEFFIPSLLFSSASLNCRSFFYVYTLSGPFNIKKQIFF